MELNQYPDDFNLQKYWMVLKRRWLPAAAVFSIVVSLSALAAVRQKPVYEAEGKLLLKVDRQTDLIGLVENQNQRLTVDGQSSALTTQAEVIRSIPVAQKVIDGLNLRDAEGQPLQPQAFVENLAVRPVGGTDVLRITYTADDPEVAAAVVNRVARAYVEQSVFANRQEAAEASKFIREQLPKTESAVREAESALREFKEQNGVIALQEEARVAVGAITNLQQQLTQARATLADADARTAMLQSQLGMTPQQALVVSSLSQSSGVTEVLAQLQEAESLLSVERTRYRDAHPTIAALERRVAALNDTLDSRVGQIVGSAQGVSMGDLQIGEVERTLITDFIRADAERSGLSNQVSLLASTESAYRGRASSLPRLEQAQRELERRLAAAQTTYEALLTRLQEIQVTENQNVGNARLISPALVPENSAGPGKSVYLLLGGLAGLAAGIISAFLLDMMDSSVRTIKQARELFGYTLLGVIPTFNRNGRVRPGMSMERTVPRVILRDCPHSPVADSYQMLQANLKFLNSDKQVKTVVVTSSAPKEGKSEVSANLADAIAQVGHKVLLVDADMRHPTQHHTWDLTNSAGLSNVLTNHIEFKDAVQRVSPNLDVLTAGSVPPNPMALLDSKHMALLVDKFSDDYDYVVFDTPPVAGTADAAVIGKMVDGVVMVVRPGVVDPGSASAAKEYLAQSGQNVLGIVVNGVDVRNEPDSFFYYSREYNTRRNLTGGINEPLGRVLAGSRETNR